MRILIADDEKEKGENQGHRYDLYRDRTQFLVEKQFVKKRRITAAGRV